MSSCLSLRLVLLFGLCSLVGCAPTDSDGDGWPADQDCNDEDADVHPEAEEVCGNGVDEDCGFSPECRLSGSTQLGDVATLLPATAEGQLLGSALAALGDLDGDGFADFAAGLPGEDAGADGAGGLVLWFGSEDGPSRPITLHGTTAEARAGSALAGPGDVDGDGIPDLLVGAPGEGTLAEEGDEASLLPQGAAYLLRGPFEADGPMEPTATLRGAQPGDCAGATVAAPGDLDGDGLGELLIGSPCSGSYRQFHEHIQAVMLFDGPGSAHLVSTPPTGESSLSEARATFTGESTWDRLGASLSGVADQDGDGQPDLAVGAPDYFGAEWINPDAQGRVFVFAGSSTGSVDSAGALATIEGGCCGLERHDELGRALATSAQGLLLGAPNLTDFEIEGGAFLLEGALAGVIDGFEEGSVLAGPPQPNEPARAGWAVAANFDFDCDGTEDHALGAPRASDEGPRTGAVLVHYGPTDDYVALQGGALRLIGGHSGDETGTVLLAPGDVDGDGCDDLLIAAPARDVEANNGGGLWFVRGRGE